MANTLLSLRGVSKTYATGVRALSPIDLDVNRGEIFALLGPNGAGKTTLIGIVCGLVNPTEGAITVDGLDVRRDYRAVRAKIGLVPQELSTDAFETVWETMKFSRGLFGLKPNSEHLEKTLKALSLWDKKDAKIMTLSGGMKRRVMIAKALAHEPTLLFLDEPSAGVDVELRLGMWDMVRSLREEGVTIVLTTHYIEEAEEMADRVGVIARGSLVLVEEKTALMRRMGARRLIVQLREPLTEAPVVPGFALSLAAEGRELVYTFNSESEDGRVGELLRHLSERGVDFKDLRTEQSSLEDIFVSLVKEARA